MIPIDCKKQMPPDLQVVMVQYSGPWPHRSGGGGITDIYAYNGEWFNIPDSVTIDWWLPIPGTHLYEQMNDVACFYYESHITIEPVFDERRELAASLAKEFNFKLADLLMKKRSEETEVRSDKDTFMTGHSKSKIDIETRTKNLVIRLQKNGFKVWRYKIEDTLLDSRNQDVWNLINPEDK